MEQEPKNNNPTLIKIEVGRMLADLISFKKHSNRLENDTGIETIGNHSVFQIHKRTSIEQIAEAFAAEISEQSFDLDTGHWVEASIVIEGIKVFAMYQSEEEEK